MENKMRFSYEDFRAHENNYDGYCTKCGSIQHGNTEPDAEGYECSKCGEMAVLGMDNALCMGFIEVWID
jgi:hypothetical protein